MTYQQRISAFIKLGEFFRHNTGNDHPVFNKAYIKNNWFTPESIRSVFSAWADLLSPAKLDQWLSAYHIPEQDPKKNVAIIMAGNIPLVGLHDLLCVLIAGNHALVKLSSQDEELPRLIINELIKYEPAFVARIKITEGPLPKDFHAVIATGSNNSNRYFKYYFRDKPGLLRKNRNSLALLTGNETPEDLKKLADDVFMYFGMGCRNVSKLLLPDNYDFNMLFEAFEKYKEHINHNKYANNYTYHKAIFLMNQTLHLDNGFLLVKEDEKLASPLACLFYQFYNGMEEAKSYISQHEEEIQCVVSKIKIGDSIPFGKAQQPELWDYADERDTMKFLLELK